MAITINLSDIPMDMTLDIGISGKPVGRVSMNMTAADIPAVSRAIGAMLQNQQRILERRRII